MTDYLFRGTLAEVDQDVKELTQLEAERQCQKLILIPSESAAPQAVREALGSIFQNIYAEGYPDEITRQMREEEILDYTERLSFYRRHADPRYYKGVEYADVIEALARRRCAELFAARGYSADQIYINVQPLSGAPANNAVYTALLNPGDVLLGMNLLHGGHLTHGSSVNRSGKLYQVVHYNVNPHTELIDYDSVEELAIEYQPKIIIAGYSSYPWVPDWARFRAIADQVGAILLADVSHIAGLIAGGAVESPVGYAQVITFTTHKTLCGPRGACILTTEAALSRKIDRGVFPGEQGGPHVHAMAALATALKLAKSEQFRQLQRQIVKNCAVLVERLAQRGLRISYGGTDTHLANIDCKTIRGPDGSALSGDIAARILDIAGIVCNRNTIPGDTAASNASGIRFGTPWMTQRGLKEAEMVQVADFIADILQATIPYTIETHTGPAQRAKIDFNVLEETKLKIRALAENSGGDIVAEKHGYPHFYYIDDQLSSKNGWSVLELHGAKTRSFANYAFTSDVEALQPGQSQPTCLVTPRGAVNGILSLAHNNSFRFSLPSEQASLAATFLRALSDGYIAFDPQEKRLLPGPIAVLDSSDEPITFAEGSAIENEKAYAIGLSCEAGLALPEFTWIEKVTSLRKTPLTDAHLEMRAKMIPFEGWEMPLWYSSVDEEHLATRQAAGLFDVSHMGIFQAEGRDTAAFLDSVCGNDIAGLAVGQSCYTHFLDPHANVIDDALIYHRDAYKFLIGVNASNHDRDWAWLNAVLAGKVRVDVERPWVKAFGRATILKDLGDPRSGDEMLVDIALQGPKSREILLALGTDIVTKKRILTLKRTELCDARIGEFDLVVSRTGYTGEKMAFELFVHPAKSIELWRALLKVGEPLGLKPCGMGARDSLRTEAGLPNYGHEIGGELNLGAAEAGFGSYIKTSKPWFIGREAYMARDRDRKGMVARFRFNEKGVRMAYLKDPVVDPQGRVIGVVTSCALDSDGYLTGQAYLDRNFAEEGEPIAIFQSASETPGKAPAALTKGDRVILPSPATVISRFLKHS